MKAIRVLVQSLAVIGGFFLGATFSILALGLGNPASYDLDFKLSGLHVLTFASLYTLWQYPVLTLIIAFLLGILGGFITRKLLQNHRSVLAWCLGGAGIAACSSRRSVFGQFTKFFLVLEAMTR